MKTHRLARVSEVIREVAAETILFEIRDPRVKNITVTRVETAADLQTAKVYVSIMGTEAQQRRGLMALQNAAGFVQSRLAKRLTTRFLPTLTFILDEGVKKSIEIFRILNEERKLRGEPELDASEMPLAQIDDSALPEDDDSDEVDKTESDADDSAPDEKPGK
ncbi:MAG: 30S ribosome-binding factor RbfA [Fimbriiglobus sp.]